MRGHGTGTVLRVEDLHVDFPSFDGDVRALNGVTLHVNEGEIVGLVGESGSGKSVTAMMAMRLAEAGSYAIPAGRISLLGKPVLDLDEAELERMRGRDVAMIFQEPMNALNPTKRIGQQIREVIRKHNPMDKAAATATAREMLKAVRLADPDSIMRRFPFELSGGMRQRVLIAITFSCRPKLIIADEPTTALDVTVQHQVLTLLKDMAHRTGTAVLLITHDLAVVSQLCGRTYVMYAGEVVESGPTSDVISRPAHPYTRALLQALPEYATRKRPIAFIGGTLPDLRRRPAGCVFAARCTLREGRCDERPPAAQSGARKAFCWKPGFPDAP